MTQISNQLIKMGSSCSKTDSSTFTKVEKIQTMELYIKAGPNDGEVGDCPFAHYVRCVLEFKGIQYQVKSHWSLLNQLTPVQFQLTCQLSPKHKAWSIS